MDSQRLGEGPWHAEQVRQKAFSIRWVLCSLSSPCRLLPAGQGFARRLPQGLGEHFGLEGALGCDGDNALAQDLK